MTTNYKLIIDTSTNDDIDGIQHDGTTALTSYLLPFKGYNHVNIKGASQKFRMLIKIICFEEGGWFLDTTPIQNVSITYSGSS